MKKTPYSLYEFIILIWFCVAEVISCKYLDFLMFLVITLILVVITIFIIGDMELYKKIENFQEKHNLASFEVAQYDYFEVKKLQKSKHIPFSAAEWQYFSNL